MPPAPCQLKGAPEAGTVSSSPDSPSFPEPPAPACSEGLAPASGAPLGGEKGGCKAFLRKGSGTLCQLATSERWHLLQKRNYSSVPQEHILGIPFPAALAAAEGVWVRKRPKEARKVLLPGKKVSPLLYDREKEAEDGFCVICLRQQEGKGGWGGCEFGSPVLPSSTVGSLVRNRNRKR